MSLGVRDLESKVVSPLSDDINIAIRVFSLKSKTLKYLPRTLRHIITFLELTLRFVSESVQFKPDVIHCHDVIVLPLACIVKLVSKSKLIYDAHELESNRNAITPLQGFLTKTFEKCLWSFVNHLIVVSDSIGIWYNENIGSKKYSVILNSPVVKTCEEKDEDYLRSKFKISPEKKVFIYVGILGHGRGIDLILNTFTQKERSSSVVFLGFGELVDEIKSLSNRYDNIFYHEAVKHDEVVSVASSADYGFCLIQNVSLSDYLCLPNKLFEYCFAGVPVVASNFPEIKKITTKYNLGFCVDLELESIKNMITSLENLKDRPVIDKKALEDLSWDAQAQKLEKLYREL